MSKLSLQDLATSDDPPTRGLDRYDPCEIDPPVVMEFLDRIKFLRLGGYPLGAAIIGAWRMGRGRPVSVNYVPRRTALPPGFDPPTPSQMFARLGLLLVIALGFALVAQLLL
jgi:hypothetical protein